MNIGSALAASTLNAIAAVGWMGVLRSAFRLESRLSELKVIRKAVLVK
jgi:hypothetical protein